LNTDCRGAPSGVLARTAAHGTVLRRPGTAGSGRSATLPDLADRFHAFEQRSEIAALDPDELDAAGCLKQARLEHKGTRVAVLSSAPQ
jgi:hypothetical protein